MPGRVLGMILAGGRVGELTALTLIRPKSAVPFGGLYRVIDCALTNMTDSGIQNIGILSQYRPLSLMDHVGTGKPWDLSGFHRGVRFLPPHTGVTDADWYKGTADALFQNIDYIRSHHPDRVLIVSGDHIYRMNYDVLFELHQARGAELTMAVTPVSLSIANRFGIVRLGPDNRVLEYAEKPVKPFSNLASMTVYLFETDVLIRELERNAAMGHTFQIYDEILPEMVRRGTVFCDVFHGYWSYSRSVAEYYRTNMDCIGTQSPIDLVKWSLNTKFEGNRIGDPPPMLTESDCRISNALISPGAVIEGEVSNSVLSPMVRIESGAVVRGSIIFEGVKVERDAVLENVIVDKNVTIGAGARIGGRFDESTAVNESFPGYLYTGITIIGKNAVIPTGVTIGRNVLIYPETRSGIQPRMVVPDGATIGSDEEV